MPKMRRFERAAVAIKADREVALAQFDRGRFNKGSLDISKDFYPFCIRLTDGKLIARPILAAIQRAFA
jgi:hypothetical protein